jgi:SanA protein
MFKRLLMMIVRTLIVLSIFSGFLLLAPRVVTSIYVRPNLYDAASVPARQAAIVFGAGLRRDGSPSPVLRDRVARAVELYFDRKVAKILMSGDNRFEDYNEPAAMRDFAVSLGVPEEDIVLDFAGRRTYDTCFRARSIFGLENAILVTQRFHLPRALYTCNALNLPAVGVPADRRDYSRGPFVFWNAREVVATFVAFVEIHITSPVPVLGEPQPIFTQEET